MRNAKEAEMINFKFLLPNVFLYAQHRQHHSASYGFYFCFIAVVLGSYSISPFLTKLSLFQCWMIFKNKNNRNKAE